MAPRTPQQTPGGGTGTATRTRPKAKVTPPTMWKVIIYNDDFTTQEFVVWILMTVFRKPEPEAVQIMLSVHKAGKGIAGLYPFDVADTKIAQVKAHAERREFPLLCTMEPEA